MTWKEGERRGEIGAWSAPAAQRPMRPTTTLSTHLLVHDVAARQPGFARRQRLARRRRPLARGRPRRPRARRRPRREPVAGAAHGGAVGRVGGGAVGAAGRNGRPTARWRGRAGARDGRARPHWDEVDEDASWRRRGGRGRPAGEVWGANAAHRAPSWPSRGEAAPRSSRSPPAPTPRTHPSRPTTQPRAVCALASPGERGHRLCPRPAPTPTPSFLFLCHSSSASRCLPICLFMENMVMGAVKMVASCSLT